MARRTTMSWEPRARRWWKQHLGRRYVVSCRQLKTGGYLPPEAPETKEASRDAANRWLADQLTTVAPCRFDHLIKTLEARKRFCEAHPDEYLGRYATAVANAIDMLREIATLDSKTPLGELAQYVPAAEAVHNLVNHDADLWADRARFLKSNSPGKTVGVLVGQFLDLMKARVDARNISPSEYDMAQRCLFAFRDWMGSQADVGTIDADAWERWYKYLLLATISGKYKKHRLRWARNFVTWVAGKGLVTVPLNLNSRLFRFGTAADEKEVVALTPMPVR